jgi:hypothetical protein
MLKSLDTASNVIRAVVALIVVGGGGTLALLAYRTYRAQEIALEETSDRLAAAQADLETAQRDLETTRQELDAARREIERLATAVRLLKVDRRIAQIEVVGQQTAVPGDGTTVRTTLRFVEVDDEGRPLDAPREYTIRGDVVHVDGLVIKFADELVEQGDPLRGTAVYLFDRLYDDFTPPQEGHRLEPVGSRPAAYSRGDEPTPFERELWQNFWQYANDPDQARAAGVRATHGTGFFQKLVEGVRYRVELRSTGEITIVPESREREGT